MNRRLFFRSLAGLPVAAAIAPSLQQPARAKPVKRRGRNPPEHPPDAAPWSFCDQLTYQWPQRAHFFTKLNKDAKIQQSSGYQIARVGIYNSGKNRELIEALLRHGWIRLELLIPSPRLALARPVTLLEAPFEHGSDVILGNPADCNFCIQGHCFRFGIRLRPDHMLRFTLGVSFPIAELERRHLLEPPLTDPAELTAYLDGWTISHQ